MEYDQGKMEIVSVKVKQKNESNMKVMALNVPPRTNIWLPHIHVEMPSDTLEAIKR